MRTAQPAKRTRLPVTVRLEVDGVVQEHVFQPKGLKSDGASVGELRVPLTPGTHRVAVSLVTGVATQQWQAEVVAQQAGAEFFSLGANADPVDICVMAKGEAQMRGCDIISIHVPYGKATHHLIGGRELALLKDGALVVHTARGGVLDDGALAEAVRSGRIRAALDVFEDEPSGAEAPFASPVRELPGLYATPHIGASTEQAERATSAEAARIIDEYLRTGNVPSAVNLQRGRAARYAVVVRHRDRVGVLAGILGGLREEQLNVQEMQNVVFEGQETACASISLERQPSAELLDRLRAQPDVIAVDLRAIP